MTGAVGLRGIEDLHTISHLDGEHALRSTEVIEPYTPSFYSKKAKVKIVVILLLLQIIMFVFSSGLK